MNKDKYFCDTCKIEILYTSQYVHLKSKKHIKIFKQIIDKQRSSNHHFNKKNIIKYYNKPPIITTIFKIVEI